MKRKSAILLLLSVLMVTFLLQIPAAHAEVITFDGPGYVAGNTPPLPWTDVGTSMQGSPSEGVVYKVEAGVGVGGTQGLAVHSNYSYFEPYAAYEMPKPLTPGNGAKRISVMFDPAGNDPFGLRYSTFGVICIGRGGWMQYETAVWRGVVFEEYGNNEPTAFQISGPGGVFGYFIPSAAQNYYTVTFDINSEFTSIVITVTYPDGSTVTQTTNWDGKEINKVWLAGSNQEYYGQPGYFDNLYISQNLSANDVNADDISDIFVENTSTGMSSLWFMNADGTVKSEKSLWTDAGSHVVGTGDFNGDGISDLLKRNTSTGKVFVFFLDEEGNRTSYKTVFTSPNSTVVGTGDFDNDGIADLIKRDSVTGQNVIWYMNADGTRKGYKTVLVSLVSSIVGTGDFNGDGICDILKRNNSGGQMDLWLMNADGTRLLTKRLFTSLTSDIVGTGDFNGDGICDLIRRDSATGQTLLWFMNADGTRSGTKLLFTGANLTVAATGDYNGDGICDVIRRDTDTGQTQIRYMNADGTVSGTKILFSDTNVNVIP